MYAIIETDADNPLVIFNINTFTVDFQININETIISAHFLNSSNDFIVVFTSSATKIVQISTGQQYDLPAMTATTYVVDRANCIFTCHNNAVHEYSVSLKIDDDKHFYRPLSYGDIQQSTYEIINKSLEFTANTTSMITSMASSTPTSIYFLSFLNYFTLCSLYVLLNFRIPQHLFNYFSVIYSSVNEDIFCMFGI